ncbi:hypothetical protein MTR_0374s0040 [Medicago truncatula]|uniref:Uncharacterized protein n=1 Tax=Medicago truncatula TaxID=3880 RepID=A0A072TGA5_MEDTR|nr:hypothetical protein MTR_0374s0040 [Medicago truncatula]
MTPCIPGKKVCIQRPKGIKDEMFHMYFVVLNELGATIPLTPFEMDVLNDEIKSQVHGLTEVVMKRVSFQQGVV